MNTLSILFAEPSIFAAYLFLLFSIIGCFVAPRYYLWAPLYMISFLFALYGKIADLSTLIPLGLLALSLVALKLQLKRFLHLFATMMVVIIGFAILTHLLPGFHNLLLYKQITFGSANVPMNIYLNFDKISLGIFLLGLSIPLIKGKAAWKNMILVTFVFSAIAAASLIGFAQFTGLVSLDFKFPSITIYWLIINFFFVTIPEEAFYRGFLQREITGSLPDKAAPILSILIVSIFFALIHILYVPSFVFVVSAFLASVLYGTVYAVTKSVESAIFTHYIVNVIQFFFFSYPFKGS